MNTRMLSKVYVDNAYPECRYGCCTVRDRFRHGARKDPRVRRWTRAADKRAWRRELDQ